MTEGKAKAATVAFWVVTLGTAFWVGGVWFGGSTETQTETPAESGEGQVAGTANESGGQPMSSPRLRPGRASAAAGIVRHGDSGRSVERLVRLAESYLSGGITDRGETLKALQLMNDLRGSQIEEALGILGAEPQNPAQEFLMEAVFTRWAEIDGNAALRYASSQCAARLRDRMVSAILKTWPLSDPEGASLWYEPQRVDEKHRPLFVTHLFQGLAVRNLDDAFAASAGLKTVREKSLAARGIANALGFGTGALEKLQTWPDDTGRALAQQLIVRDWSAYDPESAAAWAVENAAPAELPQMINEAIAGWVSNDPNGAAEWLGRYHGSAAADPAVSTLARGIVHRDPESAFAWASSMSNDVMRRQTLASIIDQWRIREPEAAAEFVRRSELAEEEIEFLLR